MKNIFLTVCSTDEYLPGVLALKESLESVKSRYNFVVLITKGVSYKIENIFLKNNIDFIRIDKNIDIPKEIIDKNIKGNFSNWNNTLQKLFMFELDKYNKIVYLDSDMLVLKNIDELFEKPHMSAVVAGKSYPGNEHWRKLNSGCMVIEPRKGLLEEFIKVIPKAISEREYLGDQDILQTYYDDWENKKELELDEKYNIFCMYAGYYINKLNYKLDDMSIIHFVGNDKPWTNKNILKQYLKYLVKGGIKSTYLLYIYRKLIRKINKHYYL